MRIFYLLLLLSFIGQIDQATAQTPLFDSGASTIIGGNSGPYNNVVNINATSGTETFYFAVFAGPAHVPFRSKRTTEGKRTSKQQVTKDQRPQVKSNVAFLIP